MGKRTDFLYLNEADTIRAGVLDARRCVSVSEEVFRLLGEGDFLMGGAKGSSHGLGLVFPKSSPFPNMPLAGPDRRFAAMPAYLGGRFDVCGNKWYGSNAANTGKGLPRSVLTLVLNDKETGEPIGFLSANLLSAARTGAVPAVAARHLAHREATRCTAIGCGPINRACLEAIATQMQCKELLCIDLFEEKAEAFADWARRTLGVKAAVTDNLEEAVRFGEVISVAASRLKPLHLEDAWIQPGATVLLTGPAQADEAFWLNTKIVYDYIGLHESYVEDAIASGNKAGYYGGVIGGPLYNLIDAGKLPPLHESTDLGQIILGQKSGREKDDERITFVACGMAVFDVAWGKDVYDTAQEKGIGQKLMLWDSPCQA